MTFIFLARGKKRRPKKNQSSYDRNHLANAQSLHSLKGAIIPINVGLCLLLQQNVNYQRYIVSHTLLAITASASVVLSLHDISSLESRISGEYVLPYRKAEKLLNGIYYSENGEGR